MNIEQIIRSWKADEDNAVTDEFSNPVGETLSDQELQEVAGGMMCTITSCTSIVSWACPLTVTD